MVLSKPAKYGIVAGIIIITLGVLIYLGFKLCITKVGIDQTGVRTKVWGVGKGVVEKDYGPGWHRHIVKIDEWDFYDTTVQTLPLTKEATKEGQERQDILIRTADDYEVSLDMIVKYQLKRGLVYKLRQDIGVGDKYKIFVRTETKDVARSVFGKMKALDLYNPDEKRRRAQEAKLMLNEKLAPRYVNIVDVLILEITFDPQLERKIKNQKLAELDAILNVSKALAAERRGETQEIDASTEAVANKITGEKEAELLIMKTITEDKIEETLAEANKYLVEKHAEADLYKKRKLAEGRLLIKRAEAEGERLRRQAMTGMGGNLIVALEAARNINLADISISTQDIDLLDIDQMINKFGAPAQINEHVIEPEAEQLEPLYEQRPETERAPAPDEYEHGHEVEPKRSFEFQRFPPEQEHKEELVPEHRPEPEHDTGLEESLPPEE